MLWQPPQDPARNDPVQRGVSSRMSWRSPSWTALLRVAVLSVVAVTAVGCSSGKKAASPPPTSSVAGTTAPVPSTTAATPSSTPSSTLAPSTSTATASALSGTWSGRYSGAFQGTFTLTWQQLQSKLNGTINLSTSPGTIPLNGTVSGSVIRFGTVGSLAITYSGSVSGNSMSGTYQIHTASGSTGGPWSATKSS
jgi:hypothetical protein